MSCNKLRGRQQNTLTKRTRIATVNRNCLSQSQHTSLLSTPKGWKPHGLSFIMKKCRKTGGSAANGRPRETGKHASSDVNTRMWSHFVKQFLQSAEYNLAPATRIILTKILPSRVNFSGPKWSSYRNTQTELCRFLSDLNPDCESINWKGDFFRTLSSLIFNYMVQVLCSGRILKKQKMAHVILKKINDVTNEYVLLNSPDNFLQGVQIFVANMVSPWLEKPINYICNEGTSNKDSTNKNTINEIENQKIGIETTKKINQKSKSGKFTKTTVKGSLSVKNPDKAKKKRKTNQKTKKRSKSKTVISAVDDSEIIISLNNTNGHGEYTNEENGNDGSKTGNEKLLKSTEQLQNDNTFEADSNNNKKNQFINENIESLQQDTNAENTHAMFDDGRTEDVQRNLTMNKSSKSHHSGKLLFSEHGSKTTATISNRITDSHYYNANEDDGILNVTDYSNHSMTVAEDFSEEKYDVNRLKDEELLLKYNDKTSIDVDNDGYSDVNTDCNNGFDDDDGHHIIIMNEDGEEFESRVLDDLAKVFLDSSSSADWSNKHNNGITATESRGDESKRNCFQICADDYAQKLLADTYRNKALTRPEVCDQSTGVSYNIRKKDGSNYSVRKTILPQCNNRDLQCTMCPLDKSKLVVNTLIELKD